MLTTTVDGVWALQVFTGIETLCPQMKLRPHFPEADTEKPAVAMRHPVFAELQAEGAVIVGDDGTPKVDDYVHQWLKVISRRDMGLVVLITEPESESKSKELPERVMFSRFRQWWVSMAIYDNGAVSIKPMGTATSQEQAASLVAREIMMIAQTGDPATFFEPLTVPTDELRALKSNPGGMERFLVGQGATTEQLRAGLLLANARKSAQCSIVALQSRENAPAITDAVVTIGDTPEGRMMVKIVTRLRRQWSVLSPGTEPLITNAIVELLKSLPSGDDWFSVRNMFG